MVSITTFGVFWLCLLSLLFFMPMRYMAGALLFSCIFQGAAIINSNGKGLMPLLATEAVFILHWLLCFKNLHKAGRLQGKCLGAPLAFCLYACIATVALPVVFSGIFIPGVIYGGLPYPRQQLGFGVWVNFGLNNVLKILSILLHGSVLLILLSTKNVLTKKQLALAIKTAAVACVLVGFWETATKNGFNLLPFPENFFYSNMGYTLAGLGGKRANFTFAEPSYAGGFFGAMFIAYIAANRKTDYGTILLLMAALVLCLAGTAFVSLICGFALLFILNASIKNAAKIAAILAIFAGVLLVSGYLQPYYSLVSGKMQSFSGLERMAGNLFGLRVFVRTKGLGLGLGTVRTFSLITQLFASLGILGAGLFCCMMKQLVSPLLVQQKQNSHCRFAATYALCFFAAQCAALPDLTTPTFWFGLFICAIAANTNMKLA